MTLDSTQRVLGKAFLALLIAFAVYSNIRLIIRNNTLNERLDQAKVDLQEKETRNAKLKLLIAYYETPSYQNAEARRRLGMKAPDETVLQIKGVDYAKDGQTLEDTIYKEADPVPTVPPSNISRWWQYFFN
jgi:cell division protein FtsB